MRNTKLIFVDGIMGSGKTTLVYSLVLHLRSQGKDARAIWEGPTADEPIQPLRLSPTLPHPFAPWMDMSIDEFASESLRRWDEFVGGEATKTQIVVCDGLLFHGNFTDLFLMGASESTLRSYIGDLVDLLAPRVPVAIYLRHSDVRTALDTIVKTRGPEWLVYQTEWKLNSPCASARRLAEFAGLVSLYTDYALMCDRIWNEITPPRIRIAGDVNGGYSRIAEFLDLGEEPLAAAIIDG